jgi:hypothetical protein
MPEPDFINLDREAVQKIIWDLRESELYADRSLASYLEAYFNESPDLLPPRPLSPPIEELGMTAVYLGLVKAPEQRVTNVVTSKMFVAWSVDFIGSFLREIRNAFCGKKADHNKLSPSSYAAITAIATGIMNHFHVSSATASGIAVLILLAILRATKKSFCDMTDKEVLEALKNAS